MIISNNTAIIKSASFHPNVVMVYWLRGAIRICPPVPAAPAMPKKKDRRSSGTFRAITDIITAHVIPEPDKPIMMPVLT